MPAIYCADVYCEACAAAIVDNLTALGYVDSGDSDDYPQSFAEEPKDYPSHCAGNAKCCEPIDLFSYGLKPTVRFTAQRVI